MPSKINAKWESIFSSYDILNKMLENGEYRISANKIREFYEPRLMTKFDHEEDLPQFFKRNKISIMPLSRTMFELGHDKMFSPLPKIRTPIKKIAIPTNIQTLDYHRINSESTALLCANNSGMISDFLGERVLSQGQQGRMASGSFSFYMQNQINQQRDELSVNNSQIEIDGNYESERSVYLFEAKMKYKDSFLIRQLYYPYRHFKLDRRITKDIGTIYMVYSNDIYTFFLCRFNELDFYNSLEIIKTERYSFQDSKLSKNEVYRINQQGGKELEPEVPFPQADKFERVVNLGESLFREEKSKKDIANNYEFDERQSDYYANSLIYLGLAGREKDDKGNSKYTLTPKGMRVFALSHLEKQYEFTKCILSHKAFKKCMDEYFRDNKIPERNRIVQIMKTCNLYHVSTEETYKRRASTIRGWLEFIIEQM